MKLLLDTHVLLWWSSGDPRLSEAAPAAMGDGSNALFVSSVSAFEVATKVAIGKVTLTGPVGPVLTAAAAGLGASELPVRIRHAVAVATLPLHHRDPFDRLLVAQALVGGLVLATQDPLVRAYSVATLG